MPFLKLTLIGVCPTKRPNSRDRLARGAEAGGRVVQSYANLRFFVHAGSDTLFWTPETNFL